MGGCGRRSSSNLYRLWDANRGAAPDDRAQMHMNYGTVKGAAPEMMQQRRCSRGAATEGGGEGGGGGGGGGGRTGQGKS